MITPTGQKRQGRIVLSILLIAFALDKYGASRLVDLPGLIRIDPMPVFLDIPVDLSGTFGLIPVIVLFALLYAILLLPYRSFYDAAAWQGIIPRWWRIVTGLLAIPLCVLSGGILYLLAHDHLPRHARNAIESFGINADIYTSFPGHELIHLRGSMIMLGCFFIGLQICSRRIRIPARHAGLLSPDEEPAVINKEMNSQGVSTQKLLVE